MDKLPDPNFEEGATDYRAQLTIMNKDGSCQFRVMEDQNGKSRAIVLGNSDKVMCDCDGSIDRVATCFENAKKMSEGDFLIIKEIRLLCAKTGMAELAVMVAFQKEE